MKLQRCIELEFVLALLLCVNSPVAALPPVDSQLPTIPTDATSAAVESKNVKVVARLEA